MNVFVYPGSFDPVTNGHLDIINRAVNICDKLVIGVLQNRSKNSLFSIEERVELLRKSIGDRPDIEVCSFSGLLVDFVNQKGAGVIIKGLRAISDYEYELQMAHLNKRMSEKVETLFMMAGLNYSYLSSSVIKDIALHGGNIEGLVPDEILSDIIEKIKSKK